MHIRHSERPQINSHEERRSILTDAGKKRHTNLEPAYPEFVNIGYFTAQLIELYRPHR